MESDNKIKTQKIIKIKKFGVKLTGENVKIVFERLGELMLDNFF